MISTLRSALKKSVVVEVDYLKLCTKSTRDVEDFVGRGNLLNQRQCEDLSSKLLNVTPNIRRLVSHCGASPDIFRPALEKLYLHVEKAKALVSNCCEADWLTAAVFQIQNENAFRQTLLDIGLCYNVIYEQAKSSSGGSDGFPEDLRLSSLFSPATEIEIQLDQDDLKKRLEDFANKGSSFNVRAKGMLKQCLASYLLLKLKHTCEQSEATALDTGSAILWANEREPQGTWGKYSSFLGAGSGGSGVCKAKWMGIRCAKKVFLFREYEGIFMKEAGILAHLNHPCIVKFFCCGIEQMGKHFIAMELLEKSLLELIEEQKSECFPIPIAVDLMVQMARGMCYLHGQGIAHRDLKPGNVVVNTLTNPHVGDHFCVKLVDFGSSKMKASKLKTMSEYGVGTTWYKAPEVYRKAHLNGEGKTTWFKADAFSFAMTCAHVLSLEMPFGNMTPGSVYCALVGGTRPKLPTDCPQELVGLLQACWDIEPTSRPTFVEICITLESLQHKLMRGYSSPYHDSQGMECDEGFRFIETMVKEQYAIRKVLGDGSNDEVDEMELTTMDEEEDEVDVDAMEKRSVVSVISCLCGGSLEFLPQAPYKSGGFGCNICGKYSDEEVYHCATCKFDAHKDCAEIKDEVRVFYHAHLLLLLVEYYYDNKLDVTCYFCRESLQGSKWVYACRQCNINVHALCTKHIQGVEHYHVHPLTLDVSPPRKHASCNSCNGDFKGYRYTCTRRGCSIDLHPSCIILPDSPICIFDSSHRLSMITVRQGFSCGKCGGVGFSWVYRCRNCRVRIHLDCVNYMEVEVEEAYDWIQAYEQLMFEYKNDADHVKMASIIGEVVELVDMLCISTGLEMSSSWTSRPRPVVMRLEPLVSSIAPNKAGSSNAFDDVGLQRKIAVELEERKAKRTAMTEGRLKARVELVSREGGKLKKLEGLLHDHRQSFELHAGVLEAREKLKKLQDFVYTVIHSKVGQAPRIALISTSPWRKNRVVSSRDDNAWNALYLLCEEPGHEHIATPHHMRFYLLNDKHVLEKIEPFLSVGLHVVQKALNKVTDIVDLESVTLPIWDEHEWDLRAVNFEQLGVRTNPTNEEVECVELQQGLEDAASEWLCNYFEDLDIDIFAKFGLLRVCYLAIDQGDCPRYKEGSVAWLCNEHLKQGIEAGLLEPCPLRIYHHREYDLYRGFL